MSEIRRTSDMSEVKLDEVLFELTDLKAQYEKAEDTIKAIDWHIRGMQNEKIISMKEMIRALKVISDVYFRDEKTAELGEKE